MSLRDSRLGATWKQPDGTGVTVDSSHVMASPDLWEHVDSLAASPNADHAITINSGLAYGVYCDTAGEILKIDTPRQTGFTTLALQAGYNPMKITKIYLTGSTISGNVDVYAW